MPADLNSRVVAVTGAGGFVGRAVVQDLVAGGAKVRALAGAPGDHVGPLPSAVTRVTADIGNRAALLHLFCGADTVIHLAGPPSVQRSFELAAEYARVHIQGTINVLDVCKAARISRLIYLSSAEVYGRAAARLVGECCATQARSPYGAAKIGAERFIEAHSYANGLQIVILRAFSIYGRGMQQESVLSTIVRMAAGKRIVLHDIRPVRDYCHVSDLSRAVLAACTATLPRRCTINIGTGKGTSVKELAELVMRIAGRKVPITVCPANGRPAESDIYRLVADVRQAALLLGWKPTISLESGIRELLRTP